MNETPGNYESDWTPSEDPNLIKIIDWCVMEGAEIDTENLDESGPIPIVMDGVELFVGETTCPDNHEFRHEDGVLIYPSHVAEIAGLAVLGSSLSTDLLYHLVQPIELRIEETYEGHSFQFEVDDYEESNCVWVTRRFTEDELNGDSFDALMREFIALVKEVAEAVN